MSFADNIRRTHKEMGPCETLRDGYYDYVEEPIMSAYWVASAIVFITSLMFIIANITSY